MTRFIGQLQTGARGAEKPGAQPHHYCIRVRVKGKESGGNRNCPSPLAPCPCYSGVIPMPKRLLPVVVVLLTALCGVAYADARSDAKAQVEFGISVASKGLWKEATYR